MMSGSADGPAEAAGAVAPCGLVCRACRHAVSGGCKGCSAGGGAPGCLQRTCCAARGLAGCWECGELPCGQGFFVDKAWAGLCIGLCLYVRDRGPEALVERLAARFGSNVEYGDWRFKQPEEILAALRGDAEK